MADGTETGRDVGGDAIAIIGMSGRFPDASDIATFWQQLCAGHQAIAPLADADILAAGVPPELVADPRYVKAGATLDGVELFDAAFFGYTPREAELIDPQQRLFLECASEALENAGYSSDAGDRVGVYAGMSRNSYLLFNLLANQDLLASANALQLSTSNDKDYLATRVAYKLNLKGPALSVQTACSTSLVAVHLACESLLNGECDMALAGGVTISVPQAAGYLYQEGGMQSPDGHCRAFDANAQGTVFGNGVGIVVLKRLDDALHDGDPITAVIRGSAINNDGAAKVGYTAPSVEGQAQVITLAHALAGVTPDSISYIEAHGTGTPLGDPIEIAALAKVFRQSAAPAARCAIGSVKPNIGHLDTAAGIAGLIKTALALKHRQLPPSLHFETANPQIPFAQTPFYVNTELADWPASDQPRRAGVSSFGIGGTNAHVVLEEAPPQEPSGPSRPLQLLLLSATTPAALDAATANLAHALAQPDAPPLPDVAYTLQVGRRTFAHRRMLVCHDHADAVAGLSGADPARLRTAVAGNGARPVAFVFPGQGTQYVGMAAGLYADEPVFRAALDQCIDALHTHLDRDLRAVLFPAPGTEAEATQQLTQTAVAQPALFAVEYALAQLWLHWGVTPDALFGHSLGEFVAATLAGVFTLDAALALVALRGRLMQSTPAGAMLSVALPAAELAPQLSDGLSLAALNGPRLCVVAGPIAAIEQLATTLAAQEIEAKRLHTSHAFHSALLDPILPTFAAAVARAQPQPPQRPVISNVSGTWLTAEQATDAQYWAQQMREPIQCAAALALLLHEPTRVLLELGPGATLTTLARQQPRQPDHLLVATLPPASAATTDRQTLLAAAGQLWLAGGRIDWAARSAHEQRRRVALPTYPFQRQRYWIAPTTPAGRTRALGAAADSGIYLPSWQRSTPPQPGQLSQPARWIVLGAEQPLGAALLDRLDHAQQPTVAVRAGTDFDNDSASGVTLDPTASADYTTLLTSLDQQSSLRLVYLWSLDTDQDRAADHSTAALLSLLHALAQFAQPLQLTIVARNSVDITGTEVVNTSTAAVLNLFHMLPALRPQITYRLIDLGHAPNLTSDALAERLLSELIASDDRAVAWRGVQRWIPTRTPLALPMTDQSTAAIQPGGTYLVYGDGSALGELFTSALIERAPARLILLTSDSAAAQQRSTDATAIVTLPIALDQPAAIADALAQVLDDRLDGVLAVIGAQQPMPLAAIEPATVQRRIETTASILGALTEAVRPYAPRFRVVCSAAPSAESDDVLQAVTAQFVRSWASSAGADSLTLSWENWNAELSSAHSAALAIVGRVLATGVQGHVVVDARALVPTTAADANPESRPASQDAPQSDGAADNHARPQLQNEYVAPRSEIERTIAEIWQTSLGIAQIGIYDNFFELGGHSLIAAQLVTKLRDTFQLDLPLSKLPEAPTVGELAAIIEGLQNQRQDDEQQALLKLLAELSDEEVEAEIMKRAGVSE